MTMTEQVTTKKKKPDFEKHYEWARKELEGLDNGYTKRKSEIINQLADKLVKDGMEPQKVSTAVTKNLKGLVTPKWVQVILPPEYKNKAQSKRGKGNDKSGRINSSHEQPETEQITEEEQEESIKAQYGVFQMPVEQYNTEDLEKYDRGYLIKIIKWYEEKEDQSYKDACRWDSERLELKQKIKTLEAEIKGLRDK